MMKQLLSVVSVLPVGDYATAKAWYSTWLGRPPDLEPIQGVSEWQVAPNAWIQVSYDPEPAGHTTVVVGVADIDAQRATCEAAGVPWGETQDYGSIKTAEALDPAGNTVMFVQDLTQAGEASVGSQPVVDVSMLIRKPPADVYAAFVDPDQIRRFWLAHSSGSLYTGARVTWTFKIAGAVTDVVVINAVLNRLLDLRWDDGQPLRIEFREDRAECTVVRIRHTGFGDDPNDIMASTSGFTLMLASLKAWLEHGIEAELIYASFPDAKYSDR